MENNEFKPYIPAEKVTPELTMTSVVTGILLAIIFGAANAYLGLRVGMTISASIPAAVIGMGITRIILKKNSILESNMVQTIGSAGESVAAGAIFTMPAFFLWAKEGVTGEPSLVAITLITLCGALLGVLFMIPLRNSIIVQEHGVLPYPEAQACAEVLLAGEEQSGSSKSKIIFLGMAVSAAFKFIIDGLKVIPGVIEVPLNKFKTLFATEIYPAVIGVGYICGPRISALTFAGGVLAWFVLIPAIVTFGGSSVLFPASVSITDLYTGAGAGAIWSQYVRYIGAGALATAGIISLIKSLPLIVKTFAGAVKGLAGNNSGDSSKRTEQDISIKVVLIGSLLIVLAIWLLPVIQAGIVSALIIVIFGFFFSTVSSRMVGLVGSSNNPVSGMTIATVLIATTLLKISGDTGSHGMISAITVGAVICIISALAGDMSQDLKTGFLLGATPKKQQIGEFLGAIFSALTIGGILILLNKAWGFGSTEIPAPQATLMKIVTEGVMSGNLPWALIFIGAFSAVSFEILKVPALPVAIGMYLPLELTAAIMIGGLLRWFIDRRNSAKSCESSGGVLFCSGMIAGEGLVGVLLAVFAVIRVAEKIDLSAKFNTGLAGSIIALAAIVTFILLYGINPKKKNEKAE
ncbi:putative OPT family oligopeptide transporter [Treponema rectale]|uniref:Putative OPT family oligopeptide transporter n=1 Tax=Treponema rectale TaxID=744512 RepID=A0A840SKB2_9SPIR|nr:oligopeptide transporter, OPT family [Treponema rectale]MBB5219782.1 putative OPT family oligopeptide transporter [Treponema rectale]